jgi:hypothetical protein
VSDIGLKFDVVSWFGLALLYVLPVTTLIMAGIGIAWFVLRRRGHGRRLAIVRWSAAAVAPFWLGGIALRHGSRGQADPARRVRLRRVPRLNLV